MPNHIRPRRSMLYVPGDKPRALEKARTLPCDGIIFDLEDAVAPEAKAGARATIADALRSDYGPRELILRVSAAECTEDYALADTLPLAGVLIPKVESAATVQEAASRTRHPIWCMIETPRGVLRADDIAGASDRVAGFVADPNALTQCIAAKDTYDFLGSPEGELAIAQACLYLATAPKSNAVYAAQKAAWKSARETGSLMPPMNIVAPATKLMKQLGYGKGYTYDHDTDAGHSLHDTFFLQPVLSINRQPVLV